MTGAGTCAQGSTCAQQKSQFLLVSKKRVYRLSSASKESKGRTCEAQTTPRAASRSSSVTSEIASWFKPMSNASRLFFEEVDGLFSTTAAWTPGSSARRITA
eukprot:scaffold271198_cov32-Tisochrysis_lutea.AAC.1